MTTSATKIVSATDNTNRNNNNNNNNSNHSHNDSDRRNSDASNNSYKIINNNNNKNISNNNNNNINIIDKNTNCTTDNEYVALKTQIPVALEEQQQQQQPLKKIEKITIPTTTTTANIVQNGIINLTTATTSSSSASSITSATIRAMQSDEDFNIRFVNLVRLHKCLYDKKVPEYRNRDNQEKAWSLISQETRESVIHCKERWRNLRACLSRYIKQQSGSDPQHKPYYLTEHMAFLLPFLKSTRGGGNMNYSMELHQQLTNNNSSQQSNNLSALFPISAANSMHLSAMTVIPIPNSTPTNCVEIKHSLSENDDEETIDAFDPAINGTLTQQQQQHQEEALNLHNFQQQTHAALHYQQQQQRISPALSDTASANSLQHYIPDVQLSEAPSGEYHNHHAHNDNHHRHHQAQLGLQPNAKRIKLECDGSTVNNGRICSCGLDNTVSNNSDMEFFRSILPDIAFLTAQQKRKLKIGILELIDDVVARYPAQGTTVTTTSSNLNMVTSTPLNNHMNGRQRNMIERRK